MCDAIYVLFLISIPLYVWILIYTVINVEVRFVYEFSWLSCIERKGGTILFFTSGMKMHLSKFDATCLVAKLPPCPPSLLTCSSHTVCMFCLMLVFHSWLTVINVTMPLLSPLYMYANPRCCVLYRFYQQFMFGLTCTAFPYLWLSGVMYMPSQQSLHIGAGDVCYAWKNLPRYASETELLLPLNNDCLLPLISCSCENVKKEKKNNLNIDSMSDLFISIYMCVILIGALSICILTVEQSFVFRMILC